MKKTLIVVLAAAAVALAGGQALADAIQPNDLVFGLSNSSSSASLEHIRAGGLLPDGWSATYIQSVEFDNYAGLSHNAQGNLLGVNFGSAAGGSIHWYGTDGNFAGGSPAIGTHSSRLGGLSVSPDNSKIAVTGYDNGKVMVYDYTAGDGQTVSSSLSPYRESGVVLTTDDTQGTAWLSDDVVLAFATDGEIYAIDADDMTSSLVTTLSGCTAGPGFTDLEYNPAVSDYVFAMYSAYSGGTTNTLYAIDPSDWSLKGTWDFSSSMNTSREIALDADGNLYVSQYGSTVDIVPDAASLNITANGSVNYYTSGTFASFNGIDVAASVPEPATLAFLAAGGLFFVRRRR